jgi:hypothetical protein
VDKVEVSQGAIQQIINSKVRMNRMNHEKALSSNLKAKN